MEKKREKMIIESEFKPIMVVPAVPHNNGIRFLLPTEQIDIGEKFSKEVWKIIEYSNGYRSVIQIIEETKLNDDVVYKIISDLVMLKIIYDSRELYQHFHEISYSPDRYYHFLTREDIIAYSNTLPKKPKSGEVIPLSSCEDSGVSNVITKRRSCRNFSEKQLTKNSIGNICFNAYNIKKHVVPSGGGLYPLKIYVLVEKNQDSLQAGYYEYDSENNSLICFNKDVDIEQLKYCFNDEELPFGSSVQIIIAADLKRQTYKYSNRGYRLTLLEVGHVAQNINLYCTENGIGVCELGGVLDEILAEELNLVEEKIEPILAIAVGYPSDKEKRIDYLSIKDDLMTLYVGKNNIIKECNGYYFGNKSSFFAAYSSSGKKNKLYGSATSTSYGGAMLKAIVEGYERNRSSEVRVDYIGCAKNIDGMWLNPNTIKPLSEKQINQEKLESFTENLSIKWTLGKKKVTGESVFVPVDLVYYGFQDEKNRICYGDSSGVAAYTNYEDAEEKAILELVERDAIMRNWYKHEPPAIIDNKLLPIHIQKRINYWRKNKYNVYVLDLESQYAPSFLVIIVGNEYPCFACGAASTIVNVQEAMNKALQEAEFSLLLNKENQSDAKIKMEDIKTPDDHGLFYSSPENVHIIQWLWTNNKIKKELPKVMLNYMELLRKIDPIIVDISETGSMIKVIRAISSKCVPIGFGYKLDYHLHPEVEKINISMESLEYPHYFA